MSASKLPDVRGGEPHGSVLHPLTLWCQHVSVITFSRDTIDPVWQLVMRSRPLSLLDI